MATSWTQTDINTLERAIADGLGARSITFENQTVTFSSVAEMLQLLATMRGAVAGAAGTTQRTRFATFSKGV
jgi:hypothetical protein